MSTGAKRQKVPFSTWLHVLLTLYGLSSELAASALETPGEANLSLKLSDWQTHSCMLSTPSAKGKDQQLHVQFGAGRCHHPVLLLS